MLGGASQEMRAEHLQANAMNIVELVCDAISEPVQKLVRPFYGTLYYPVPVTFLAAMMMILMPAFVATVQGVAHMIPFLNIPAPAGMFGLGSFAELCFLVTFIHGIRLWRRMFDVSREEYAQYEGHALFFFSWLPKADKFWFVRIIWEPLFVLLASIVLQDLYIIQSPLSLYLKFAAMALVMKNFIGWFRDWEVRRKILDGKYLGQVFSKIADGTATQAEQQKIHIASIPGDEARKAAFEQINQGGLQ
jgi:hypothetical protein